MVEWKEVLSRLVWVKVKFGRELWVFASAYDPGSERKEIERKTFWNDLYDCLQSFVVNMSIVLLGDVNGCVGDEVVEDVVGRRGMLVAWEEMNV